MRLFTSSLALIALSGVLLAGCSSDSATTTTSTPAADPLASNVPILAKISGDQLPIDQPMLQMLDEAAVQEMGLADALSEQGIGYDFDQHAVLLLSLGEQATGGFSADITAIQQVGNELYVQGTAVAPGPDAVVTQAVTFPFCAVAIDRPAPGVKIRSDITSLP